MMRPARSLSSLVAALAMAAGNGHAAGLELGGTLRLDLVAEQAARRGPIAQADALAPGLVAQPEWTATPQAELRANLAPLHAVATAAWRAAEGGADDGWVRFNELYASGGEGAWQFTAGRRIVSWDVGEGFRPNDFIQQEPRRPLLPVLPVGRGVLMAEHYGSDTAATLLVVNPQHDRESRGAEEPALAARWYRRAGAVDWHAFARWGRRTLGSAGAAAAWIASESLELHASVRAISRSDTLAADLSPAAVVAANPWQPASVRHATQALVGGSWAGEARQSLLLEAWWDGSAPADAQWDAWRERNARLALPGGAPAAARAGNLAWQASAFSAAANLRRLNLFARASWKLGDWEPAFSLLYTPADDGRSLTGSLVWQGDRVRVEGGLRINGGPDAAVLAQVPTRHAAYTSLSWRF